MARYCRRYGPVAALGVDLASGTATLCDSIFRITFSEELPLQTEQSPQGGNVRRRRNRIVDSTYNPCVTSTFGREDELSVDGIMSTREGGDSDNGDGGRYLLFIL